MRLSPANNGEYLTGVGGGGGRVHVLLGSSPNGDTQDIGDAIRSAICARLGIPVSGEGSGWFWKTKDVIAGQFCGDPSTYAEFGPIIGCTTWEYNIRTGALAGPIGPGANNGKGRGGTAAFWVGNYGQKPEWIGVYDTNGYHNTIGAVVDVFANGDVLVLKDYQQNTLGMEIVRGKNKIADVPTLGQIQGGFARGQIALWMDFGDRKVHAYGAPAPADHGPNWTRPGPFASDGTGRVWIVDGQEGLLLKAWDAPIGRWLSHDEYNFFPDISALPDGRVRVVSSMNQGETPGMMRVFDVDMKTGAYTFNGAAGTAPLINLIDGSPAELPPPPAQPQTTTAPAGNADSDLFPIALGAFALFAVWMLTKD